LWKFCDFGLYIVEGSSVAGRQGDCYILPILEVLANVARDCKRDIYSRFLHLYSRELYTSNISLSLLIIYTYAHTSLNNRLFVACLCVLLLLCDYIWFSHALVLSFVIALYLHMRLLVACLLGIRETFL
jgi:hypothetical protein